MGVRERQNKTFRYFKLNQTVDKDNVPMIIEKVKVNGSYQNGDAANELFGVVTNVQLKEDVFNGEKTKSFNVIIDDGEEVAVVNMRHGSVTRDILNKLADPEKDLSRPISLQVYRSKSESKDGSKVYYNGLAAVRDDETKELFAWTVHPNDFPKLEITTLKSGKKVVDSTDLDTFFEKDILGKIQDKLKGVSAPTSQAKTEVKKGAHPQQQEESAFEPMVTEVEIVDDEEDGLPFN